MTKNGNGNGSNGSNGHHNARINQKQFHPEWGEYLEPREFFNLVDKIETIGAKVPVSWGLNNIDPNSAIGYKPGKLLDANYVNPAYQRQVEHVETFLSLTAGSEVDLGLLAERLSESERLMRISSGLSTILFSWLNRNTKPPVRVEDSYRYVSGYPLNLIQMLSRNTLRHQYESLPPFIPSYALSYLTNDYRGRPSGMNISLHHDGPYEYLGGSMCETRDPRLEIPYKPNSGKYED